MATDHEPVDDRHEGGGRVTTTPLRASRSKRWFILLPLIILMIATVGYFGVDWWIYSLSHVSTDDARVKGTLITVSPRVAGRLTSVLVEQGQPIQQGEVIARIQQDDYLAQAKLSEAVLEAAKSELASATLELELAQAVAVGEIERSEAILGASESQLAEAEKAAGLESQIVKADLREKAAAVEEARAQLLSAKINQDMAEGEFKRAQQLFEDGIIATEQRDQMAAAYDRATAQYQSAQETLNKSIALLERATADSRRVQLLQENIRTQQGKVKESAALKSLALAEQQRVKMQEEILKTLQAKVKEAQARLDLARLRLDKTVITSPVDGVVSQAIADPGEHIQPGQPIAIVNDPQDVWVEANIEETDIRKIQLGQPVDLDVDAYPQRKFAGKVIQIGAATRSEFAIIPAGSASAHFIKVTQRLPVKIAVDNREGLLKPGMMVVAGIRVK
jgi:membrane fusion protein (multidrug efflux system)